MLEKEIKDNHKKIHDDLAEDYYKKKLVSKEDFDYYHGQNWNDMEAELIAEGYRQPPEPVRDLVAEIDELRQDNILLRAEIEKLKEIKDGT